MTYFSRKKNFLLSEPFSKFLTQKKTLGKTRSKQRKIFFLNNIIYIFSPSKNKSRIVNFQNLCTLIQSMVTPSAGPDGTWWWCFRIKWNDWLVFSWAWNQTTQKPTKIELQSVNIRTQFVSFLWKLHAQTSMLAETAILDYS